MLYAFGVGEVPISVCGAAGAGEPLVHTVRAVGAVTQAICAARAGRGARRARAVRHAWPVAEAAGGDVVIVAGGLGLAPLRPVDPTHARATASDYGEVGVLYGSRTPADLLYRASSQRWRARLDLQVDVTVDSAGPELARQGRRRRRKLSRRAEFDPAPRPWRSSAGPRS